MRAPAPPAPRDRRDPGGGAARRGEPGELVAGPEVLRDPGLPGSLDHHEALAVGRPDRIVVEGRRRRETLLSPAVRPDLHHRAALLRPGDVRDPLPVRGPGGHLLVHRVGGEAARRAVREVHHVHPVEGAERESPPVGGRRRVADLLHENVPRVHPRLEPHEGADLLSHRRGERDLGRLPRRDLDPPDLAPVGRDERLRVRRERRARHQVAGEARLLVVALHRVHEPLLVPGGQVPQPQSRFRVVAGRVHEPPAVG